MPQDTESQEREFRKQMRSGRAPLIEAIRVSYQPYLLAMKGWQRKNAELREQVGLLNNEFSNKSKLLRDTSRNTQRAAQVWSICIGS